MKKHWMKFVLAVMAIAFAFMLTACDEGTPTTVTVVDTVEVAPPPVDLSTMYTMTEWKGEGLPKAVADFLTPLGYDARIRSASMKLEADGTFFVTMRILDVSDDDFPSYFDGLLAGRTFPLSGANTRFQYDAVQLSRSGVVLVATEYRYIVECLVFEDAAECADDTFYRRD